VRGVSLVPSGTPFDDEIELLTQAGRVVAEATELAEIVIIDTPPITSVSDASELVPFVDGVVFVCRASSARVVSAKRALDIAERVGAPLLGVVLLRRKAPRPVVRAVRKPVKGRLRPVPVPSSAPQQFGPLPASELTDDPSRGLRATVEGLGGHDNDEVSAVIDLWDEEHGEGSTASTTNGGNTESMSRRHRSRSSPDRS
jgi:hypothetical protein